MKLEIAKCPECGEPPKATLELVPGDALLSLDEKTGEFEYEGETEMNWDGQETIADADGRATLVCHNGHNWQSHIE